MISRLRNWLLDPAVKSLDVDDTDFSIAHRQVLMRKRILQELFVRFYKTCRWLDEKYFMDAPGRRVEIGSGSSIIKEVFPEQITSDIKPLPFVDVVFRAENMPFREESTRSIYAINVFHHLSEPRVFFRELQRTVSRGGGAIFVEPYYGPVARWLFPRLHQSEGYELEVQSWDAPE